MDAVTPVAAASDGQNARSPALERAQGAVRLAVRPGAAPGTTELRTGYQQGSFKVRFPRLYGAAGLEAVLLNTAGGLTDGDRFTFDGLAEAGSMVTITTQAAERVYRAVDGEAHLDVSLDAEAGSALFWIPQETILYDGGRLRRRLDARIDGSARILLCETTVMGRAAHGETVSRGGLRDRWRLWRDGRLAYADDFRLAEPIPDAAGGIATLGGGRAVASLVWAAPDAEARLDEMRAALDLEGVAAGASAWDGLLSARLVAGDAAPLRRAVAAAVTILTGRLPRVWSV
ncbi:urease accessory protein UreD [Amorphus orientalis]|uniref:Urease accessory protein UreD n=1 Tax=Amorphus orientalis TaxID=649198 RepID=A0AAE4ASC1_9HYPH|nr:urease accessory protein UreD [Amorphus orientalis]MDQ0315088.1 urease accessory protein [Amorphus orientalis]